MAMYEVTLERVQYITVRVRAEDQEEAEELAHDLGFESALWEDADSDSARVVLVAEEPPSVEELYEDD